MVELGLFPIDQQKCRERMRESVHYRFYSSKTYADEAVLVSTPKKKSENES